MPMTPFIGVRISWLMVDRNSLLACVAASAWSRARASCSVWPRSAAVRSATVSSRWASMACCCCSACLLRASVRPSHRPLSHTTTLNVTIWETQ